MVSNGSWYFYQLKHEPFVAFDIFTKDNKALNYHHFLQRLESSQFITPYVVHEGHPISLEKILLQLGQGGHGAIGEPEGVIWRLEVDYKVKFMAKYVRKNKIDGVFLKETLLWKNNGIGVSSMKSKLDEILRNNKMIRVMGIDDAPFEHQKNSKVNIAAVICSQTRFEGMLWGEIIKDGNNSTAVLIDMIQKSKFYNQLHVIIIDGIAVGGFNIIDLQELSNQLNIPCLAVMRKMPNLIKIDKALRNLDDYKAKKELLQKAGTIYQRNGFTFQVSGCSESTAGETLVRLTDCGKVPEALRIAHFIGSAVKSGESGRRA